MRPCSVFAKSPVNLLSYLHNLKKKKRKKLTFNIKSIINI